MTAPSKRKGYALVGKVVSTKWQSSDYGDTLKMLVKATEGFKVWMTVPSGLDVETGDQIEVTVTVEASDNDEYFGFGKRPSKARVLAPAG